MAAELQEGGLCIRDTELMFRSAEDNTGDSPQPAALRVTLSCQQSGRMGQLLFTLT